MPDDFIFSKTAESIFGVLQKMGIVRGLLDVVFPFYGKVNNFDPSSFRFYAIGQSHLDTAWNWTWNWTKKKIRNTFGNAIQHLEEYPEFKFSGSAPVHYEYFEKAYPSMFAKIQKFVKEGRWDIVGGMWCEPDGNVPDGESLVRQRLYGQKYYMEKFGKRSLVAWVPDSFGFTWTYPQIFLKSGSPYFHTTKLTWNLEHEFPFSIFYWEGPDESRVLSYNFKNGFRALESVGTFGKRARLLPEGTQETNKFNYETDFEKDDLRTEDFIRDFGHWYGYGDGGAGPLLVELLIPVNLSKTKGWQFVKAATYYKLLERDYGKRIPIWKDELYLEVHRGCQTTLYRLKKNNRIGEVQLPKLEKLAICSNFFMNSDASIKTLTYPTMNYELMDECWKILLFNQFHDILPGSSIEEVYDDSDKDFEIMFDKAGNFFSNIENSISDNLVNAPETITKSMLFHPNHWEGNAVILSSVIFGEERANLKLYPKPQGIGFNIFEESSEIESDVTKTSVTTQSDGTILIKTPKIHAILESVHASLTSLKISEDNFSFEFADSQKSGNLGHLNQLKIFVDEPKSNDAWNLDEKYRQKELKTIEVTNTEIFKPDETHNYAEIRFSMKLNKSKGRLSYIFHENLPYIISSLDLDYQEHRKLLRTEFDTSISSEKITTGLAYGVIDRPTKPKQPLEEGRWEFPGQKFISLSDDSFGLSILTENRYGFDSRGKSFGMSLKKAPLYGDPSKFMNIDPNHENPKLREIAAIPKVQRKEIKDLGEHQIMWGIYPHYGNWVDARVYQTFFNFTDTPIVLSPKSIDINEKFVKLVDSSLDNVRISAMKTQYHTNEGLVIRLFEFTGIDCSGELFINPKIIGDTTKIKVYNADLLEGQDFIPDHHKSGELTYDRNSNSIKFDIKKFEIKTIVIKRI